MSISREFAMGLAKAKENDFTTAIVHFSNALAEDQANVEIYAERGVAYLNLGLYELSLSDMNACISLEPDNSYRYSCRGFLKAKMGDAAGAVADYEMAVKLDPQDAIAYNNLGLAQEQQGYQDKARKSFQRSNELIGYEPEKRRQLTITEPVPVQDVQGRTTTRSRVAIDVFTRKESFRDFLRFIRNGFKIK